MRPTTGKDPIRVATYNPKMCVYNIQTEVSVSNTSQHMVTVDCSPPTMQTYPAALFWTLPFHSTIYSPFLSFPWQLTMKCGVNTPAMTLFSLDTPLFPYPLYEASLANFPFSLF